MDLKISLEKILFLDIETVPNKEHWKGLSKQEQHLFKKKTAYQRKEDISAEEFYYKAGIWAEFGKIVCISVAYFVNSTAGKQLRVTSFASKKEKEILLQFKELLDNHFYKKEHLLCAHNGKEFDFPYIARRMIIHDILLPKKLNLFGKKPWEVPHLDTLELWKFGDYKHYTSLELLSFLLGIPSPKETMDGSQVATVFYQEDNLPKIITYCEQDTITVAQVFLRLYNESLIEEKDIVRVSI